MCLVAHMRSWYVLFCVPPFSILQTPTMELKFAVYLRRVWSVITRTLVSVRNLIFVAAPQLFLSLLRYLLPRLSNEGIDSPHESPRMPTLAPDESFSVSSAVQVSTLRLPDLPSAFC